MTTKAPSLADQFARLGESLLIDYPHPAWVQVEDLSVQVRPAQRPNVGPAVRVSVGCAADRLPDLLAGGFDWVITPVGGDRPAASGEVIGKVYGWGPPLPDGRYSLRLHYRPRTTPQRYTTHPLVGVWHPPLQAEKTSTDKQHTLVAEVPIHSPARDTVGRAEVFRTPNWYHTLRVELPHVPGRPVLFSLIPTEPGSYPPVSGYIGLDQHGVGEIDLDNLDYHTRYWLGVGFRLECAPHDPRAVAADSDRLIASIKSAVRGAEVLGLCKTGD